MEKFKREAKAFSYVYEKTFTKGEIVIVRMPPVTSHKKGVCDIGWQVEGNYCSLFVTMSSDPESDSAIWENVSANTEINKTVTAFQIEVEPEAKPVKVVIRVIMN